MKKFVIKSTWDNEGWEQYKEDHATHNIIMHSRDFQPTPFLYGPNDTIFEFLDTSIKIGFRSKYDS